MGEKLFVIMEVVPRGDSGDGVNCYSPIDTTTKKDGTYPEYLWLLPERVIPASRLRYGLIEVGETFFGIPVGWIQSPQVSDTEVLILDPPAPVDEWEKWIEDCPFGDIEKASVNIDRWKDVVKSWLRKMPRGVKP